MKSIDYIVVGSGCSGAMAAQTLVESGASVLMLDVGFTDETYASTIPNEDYSKIRTSEENQYRYFVGDDGEGIGWSDIGKGAQITPPRQHMVQETDKLIPLVSKSFSPVESLGYGGLGIGWGLQCWQYSDEDIIESGLDPAAMRTAYDKVAERIGISATPDEASRYTMGSLSVYQPSADMDRNHQRIARLYQRKKSYFNLNSVHIGRTPLALITKPKEGRSGYKYRDMDFYSDADQSAWRPWITVNYLRKKTNFTYVGNHMVLSFKEKGDQVVVETRHVITNRTERYTCKKLILATGALGSARIALRSFGLFKTKTPLLCNPYTYIPCLQPRMFGKGTEKHKLGFAQLSAFLDESKNNHDTSVASLYSYQSLMLFRTIRQLPLNFADSRNILRYLVSGIVIMGVHHPDRLSDKKYIQLVKDTGSETGDRLEARYELSPAEAKENKRREKKIMKVMRRTGIFGVKRIDPGNGASIHYAGTIPFSKKEDTMTLSSNGRLHGTEHVYVADSSGFNYLPAPGLTFSLLANAHITAENILHDKK